MKKLLLLFVLLLSSIGMSAQNFEVNGIRYYVRSDSPDYVGVSKYDVIYTGDLVLNGTVYYDGKDYKVLVINDNAFSDCKKTIIVNDLPYCTTIGSKAFYGCTGLATITIPNSVTSIGDEAFSGCFFLPSSFINNSALTNSDNWGASFVDSETKDGLLIVDNAVVKCRPWATSVTIPSSVTSIGNFAFRDCSSLTSVTIPNSVTSIGYQAFWDCSKLYSVTIPNSVTSIEGYAFYGCSGLTSVTIGNGVTSIGWEAFAYCSGLTSVSIPNSVTKIWTGAFGGCTGLTSVTIPNSVTEIGDGAFSGCTGLTSVSIPNSVKGLAKGVFSGCSGLTSVTIPNSVMKIGSEVFKNCTGLTSVTIPNSVTSIGDEAFYNCSSLTSVTIGNSVKSIGHAAFVYCTGLTSVTIPNSVTSIEWEAFYGCSGLTSVTIGNSVTSIGESAFRNCTNLISVTVGMETPVSLKNDYIFDNHTNATLYVPIGCKDAYKNADYWKNFKEIIEIANDITIGSAGMGTFCSTHPLDFSGTDDIKAYIVSAFKPSTGEVTLTRITDVPANTGIVVKGDAGTYTIPWGAGETVVANMLVGVTENTVLNKVDGDCTNYVLAKKDGSLGFYAVVDGSTLSAGKAYLPLPTAQLPSAARPMRMVFSDDEPTGIEQTVSNSVHNSEYYDLQGRRVAKPAHGLNIVNGKKVILK